MTANKNYQAYYRPAIFESAICEYAIIREYVICAGDEAVSTSNICMVLSPADGS